MEKKFDVVLWGCTGFTGGLVAEYFATAVTPKYPQLTWALAGRNKTKLQAVLQKLKTLNPQCNPGVIQASVDNQVSVDNMVRQGRVLLSTAGPFVEFGTPVVDACVRLGCDYVDTTGETPWVKSIIDSYHQQAEKNGVYVVPMCGFDSIPSDLGTFFVGQSSCSQFGPEQGQLDSVRGYYVSNGGPSGGTLRSGMNMTTTLKQQFDNPFLLGGQKSGAVRKEDKDITTHTFNKNMGLWTAPFGMAGINTRVVRRSTELTSTSSDEKHQVYSDTFSYNEEAVAPNEKFAKKMANPPPPEVVKKLIESGRLPKPGQGPSAEFRAKSFFGGIYVGTNRKGVSLVASVKGGDPGYTETSKMVAESALCLVLQRKALLRKGGVLTPSYAFGSVLVQRLQTAGIDFKVEKVGEYTPKDVMKIIKTFKPVRAKL